GHDRIIPHSDGAGIIKAVGAGVDPALFGQRVWLWNGQWQRASGTCARYITLPAEQAVALPDAVSFEQGACLGIPAMTAYRCVYADGPVEGQKVLVTGGAGTVSRYAIQMAKLGGAEVVTTVSSQAKGNYAKAAGADHVVNYKTDDVAEQVLDLTGGIDRIIELEFGANLPVSEAVIKPNGVIAAYGSAGDMAPTLPFYPLMFKGVTLRMILVYILSKQARAETIAGLSRLLEQGVLTHSVAATFPLEDAVKAHEAVEAADKMGSVVVTI
ncbi:MAG: NADPH:quinone reductase, partial [Rhodobacteraceae bacterium]|nr:NADPH:quinone reductase [Paracoccaceae bacterium]